MKRKDILIILIPSFIFVILWIVFSIHHALNTPTISNTESALITPITPNFDTKTIKSLKKREIITPIYQLSSSPNNQSLPAVPQQTISPAINSSASANQASSGGSLLQ